MTQPQMIDRLKEQYGDRQTVSRYRKYVIRSFFAWGALKDSEAKDRYEKVALVSLAEPNLAILMFEFALLGHPGGQGRLGAATEQPVHFSHSSSP